jgi:serine/threonine protein kinase
MNADVRIGELRVGRHIGRGAFSDVWIAIHPRSSDPLAIKTLRTDSIDRDIPSDGFAR